MVLEKTSWQNDPLDSFNSPDTRTNLLADAQPCSPEGSNARDEPSDGKPSVVKHKAGRKRKGRSLGRYPFLTWANMYLSKRAETYAEITRKAMDRRFRQMDRDLRMLVESGRVITSNPEKMSAEDVLGYVASLKSKKLAEKTMCHRVSSLNQLLNYAKNPAVQQF
jgi:hypothetical protein